MDINDLSLKKPICVRKNSKKAPFWPLFRAFMDVKWADWPKYDNSALIKL